MQSWSFADDSAGVRQPGGRLHPGPEMPERIGCLYNGSILTVDPVKALDESSAADRYRLWVLHAVLIDPDTGRVVAVYPALQGDSTASDPTARPLEDFPVLLSAEQPPAPGVALPQLLAYWRDQGVAERLLTDVWCVDLDGAVVTPGLIDGHFHVSSWSKKLPDQGERFGYYADVGDPSYYTDVETWDRVCVRQALWEIVTEANNHLVEQNQDKVYLHGYWFTSIDDDPPSGSPPTHLYARSASAGASVPDPVFLLNRIGRGPGAPLTPPGNPCTASPDEWPPLAYEIAPALLVHTSGQACWYNSSVLQRFNSEQLDRLASGFGEVLLDSVVQASEEEDWEIVVQASSPNLGAFFEQAAPFRVDVVVESGSGKTCWVPFLISETDESGGRLAGQPILRDVAETAFASAAGSLSVVPFYRPIVESISAADWNAAAAYWQELPANESVAYGQWDPCNPHRTNWYNGSERGLIEYFFDDEGGVWRPSGYAEHYVMRDALTSLVIDPLTAEEAMRHRRNLARWCHRHGLTSVQDIMFYRRISNPQEFHSYEGLSFDHRFPGGYDFYDQVGMNSRLTTGRFNLRVGLYYYIENAFGVDEVVRLAHSEDGGYDLDRLRPPEDHPEYPGWVRWTGWKLQLDGGTGARTLYSNAPMAKSSLDDAWPTVEESGYDITFFNHGFGLLTMTNVQEQVFTSRETAALYWLVRESDPGSAFHNSRLAHDWSFLKGGVADWLDLEIDEALLAADLAALDHAPLAVSDDPPLDRPAQLAEKVSSLFEQVRSGWERTLSALAKIWYESSAAGYAGRPMPSQVVCHNIGDGSVDLYLRALKQLKQDVEGFPADYDGLPEYWQAVIPREADLAAVRRSFSGERYRIEHLLNISERAIADIVGPSGLDAGTSPTNRNVALSTQPALLVLDGQAIRTFGFPYAQELWDIPNAGAADLWRGLAARPRSHHHMPCPVYIDHDIPFTLNTDPPSVRDPRPAITLIGAVARTPLEVDPTHWVDQGGTMPAERPRDYLVGKVYGPLGLTPATPDNPMHLTMEQALCAMTFWAAYAARAEWEQGAIAPATAAPEGDGWFADMVVWAVNPLAIKGPDGMSLESLATIAEGANDVTRVATINAFIKKLRPAMTIVGGDPVYARVGTG